MLAHRFSFPFSRGWVRLVRLDDDAFMHEREPVDIAGFDAVHIENARQFGLGGLIGLVCIVMATSMSWA